MQQLMAENRFISLAPDDPDDSDTDMEPTEPCVTEKPREDVSTDSDESVYFDAWEADDDTPYFQQGAEPPPREEWEIAAPIDFSDVQGTLQISHQLDALLLSEKEIETPLGMDDTQQKWKWADVGSRRMPRLPLTYPTVMVDDESGIRRPAASQVHHRTLFQWIVDNLLWLSQYDTAYVFVDNRMLSGTNPPVYWPYLAPWIKGRCEVTGPYREKTTAIHIPINSDTGLHQVHYTWAGAAVLEALCLVFPTVNFALTDSDCVPTSLFEIAELVNLMTDKASRAEAMQHYTMASSSQCQPAVLLTTEAKAELNAGLIIITGLLRFTQQTLTWTKKPRMPACHQLMLPDLLLVMRAPPKQDVLSIQLIPIRRTNGSLRFTAAEPSSWPPQRYQRTLRKRLEAD